MPPIEFEWNPLKNAANYAKHGLFLSDAKDIFEDPKWSMRDVERVDNEERFTLIGKHGSRIYSVTGTIRAGKVRLISARPASRKERREYTAAHHGEGI